MCSSPPAKACSSRCRSKIVGRWAGTRARSSTSTAGRAARRLCCASLIRPVPFVLQHLGRGRREARGPEQELRVGVPLHGEGVRGHREVPQDRRAGRVPRRRSCWPGPRARRCRAGCSAGPCSAREKYRLIRTRFWPSSLPRPCSACAVLDSATDSSAGFSALAAPGPACWNTSCSSTAVLDWSCGMTAPGFSGVGDGWAGVTRSTYFSPNSVFGRIRATTLGGMLWICDLSIFRFSVAFCRCCAPSSPGRRARRRTSRRPG